MRLAPIAMSQGFKQMGDVGGHLLLMRKALFATIALVALMSAGQVFGQAAIDASTDAVVVDDSVPPEISRDGWRERIQEAKRRAKEVALERRLNPSVYAPPPEDPAVIATQRVLKDDSLQPGDIVSTNKGLFVFRGRPDQPRSDNDFVALPPR